MRHEQELFRKALHLLKPIPSDQFIEGEFTDGISKCCSVGHLARLTNNPKDYSKHNCSDNSFTIDIRYASERLADEIGIKSKREFNIAHVNNGQTKKNWGSNPKERVINFLDFAIAHS